MDSPFPIRSSSDIVQAIADAADYYIFFKDKNLRYTFVNDSVLRLLGRPRDAILGKTARDVLGEETAQIIGEADLRVLAGETADNVRSLTIGQSRVTFHAIQTPIRNEAGEVMGICGILRDVTDTIRVQGSAAKAQEALVTAFNASVDPTAFATADGDQRLLEVNQAFLDLLGLERGEVIGKHVSELGMGLNPETKQRIMAEIQTKGIAKDIEVTLKRKSGDQVFGLFSACVLELADGPMLMTVMKDISQRKRAEDLLRLQRDLSLAFNSASTLPEILTCLIEHAMRIQGLDSGGIYLMSPTTGALDLAVHQGLSDQFVAHTSHYAADSIQTKIVRQGEPIFYRYADMALPKDESRNQEGIRALAVVPIKHGNRVIGAMNLASHTHDVPPKSAQDAIVSIAGMVGAAIVRAQTEAALRQSEDQLRHAEKMQAIGQLAGGVAHDFNNQLTGIVGYAELLLQKVEADPVLAQYAGGILTATKRAADLTAQLLAFARKGKYLSIVVDLHKIILEVVTMLSRSIDKRIVIKQHLNANPPRTLGDPSQLQNAILNIGLNARDAMPGGGEMVFSTDIITLDGSSPEWNDFEIESGPYVRVAVTDTGVGMSEETRNRMFEPFFTTKPMGKGTGMGLAAMYGTVKTHRGAVRVESETGKGTTMTLLLPLDVSEAKVDEVEGTVPPKATHLHHVLLVDDEAVVRDVTAAMLQDSGFEVTVCDHGRAAIEQYQKNPERFDVILLDMVMPEIDGRDAFFALRAINPRAAIILSSGYSFSTMADEMLKKGAKGFIPKPFRYKTLITEIRRVLDAAT